MFSISRFQHKHSIFKLNGDLSSLIIHSDTFHLPIVPRSEEGPRKVETTDIEGRDMSDERFTNPTGHIDT
jgi:hypothetical protein